MFNMIKIRKKHILVPSALFCIVMLCGCLGDVENVEQRDYATFMLISVSDDNGESHYDMGIAKEHHVGERGEVESLFEEDAYSVDELMKKYGELEGKELSLSHLKVIMIKSDHYVQETDTLKKLLYELDRQDEIAKTCPVLMVTDYTSVKDYLRDAKKPVGTYVSDLIKNAKRNDRAVPKLMNYLKMLRDGADIEIYGIDAEEGYLKLKHMDI